MVFMLAILGHWDEELAKDAYQQMRAEFLISSNPHLLHHRLTIETFGPPEYPDSISRWVNEWLDIPGAKREHFPMLMQRALDYATIPINERGIEMRQAQVKKTVADASSGVLVSLALRLPLLEQLLCRQPQAFDELTRLMFLMRKYELCAKVLGVHKHTKYLELEDFHIGESKSSKMFALLARIVYGHDLETQFMKWKTEKNKAAEVARARKQQVDSAIHATLEKVLVSPQHRLMERLALLYMRNNLEQDCIYSLPMDAASRNEVLSDSDPGIHLSLVVLILSSFII